MASERLSYCHESFHWRCITCVQAREAFVTGLAHAVLHDFGGLIEGFFPKELRGQFREIHSELTKVPDVKREGPYITAINSLSAREAKSLIDRAIVLREDVARAYYKRSFSR